MLGEYGLNLLEEHNANPDNEKLLVHIDMDLYDAKVYLEFLKEKAKGNHNAIYQIEDDLKQYKRVDKIIKEFEEYCYSYFFNDEEE